MITVLDCLESTAAKFAANIICSDAKKQITYTDFVKNARAIGSFLCKYEKMRQPVAFFMDKMCIRDRSKGWKAGFWQPCSRNGILKKKIRRK